MRCIICYARENSEGVIKHETYCPEYGLARPKKKPGRRPKS